MAEVLRDKNSGADSKILGCGCLSLLIGACFLGFAWPSLLSSHNRAYSAEARHYIGYINRAQQAYYLEEKTFANTVEKLGIGIKTQTEYYTYSTVRSGTQSVFNYAIPRRAYVEYYEVWPFQQRKYLKSYVGGVFIVPASQVNPSAVRGETISVAAVCEVTATSINPADHPIYQNGVVFCPPNTRKVL